MVVFAWLTKLLRIPLPASNDDPNIVSLQLFQVEESQLPEEVRALFALKLQEFAALDFVDPVFHAINDPLTSTKIFWATLRHTSGRSWGRIHHRIWSQTNPPRVHLFPIFGTAFQDGTWQISSGGKPDTITPKTVRITYSPKATTTDLWQEHQKATAAEESRGARPVQTTEELLAAIEQHHATLRDFHVRRKLFTRRTEQQDQQAAAMQASMDAAKAAGLEHGEVLAEMDRLQKARPGWGSALIIFVISMVIFAGVGSAQWTWKIALLLLPILFFHELGHYIAMRFFKYRNLRMFFIPFFGAAVSGQNYNVPGWKRAIVSLMGPLPGIVLGAVLAAIGLMLNNQTLIQIALLTLILNAFNLLPFLPLDGGWVLHAVLFSRHYMLDIAFRAIAAITLILFSLFTNDRIMMWIGIPMLIFLPISYKMAKVTAKLRNAGLPPVSEDDQTVPVPTAQAIIGELKTSLPKGTNNKTIAQYALHVFETLNARPPGWLASIAFMIVHAGSVVVAVVFLILLVIGGRGRLSDFARAAAQAPTRKLECAEMWRFSKDTSGNVAGHRQTIVANFRNRSEAEKAWRQLTNGLSSSADAKLIGESLLVAFPMNANDERLALFDRVQSLSTNVAVDSTNFHVSFSLSCVASNEAQAKAIEDEMEGYLEQTALMHLIPPWETNLSAGDRRRFARARSTYSRLEDLNMSLYTNTALTAISKQMMSARRAGDTAKLARLKEEDARKREQLRSEAIQRIRADATADAALIDAHSNLLKQRETLNALDHRAAMLKFGEHLGQLPLNGEDPDASALRHSAIYGVCHRAGLLVNLYGLRFYDVAGGVPAFVDWLCNQGCIGFQYDFDLGTSFDDIDPEDL